MKILKSLFSLLLVAGFATVGFGQITGSAHDFSAQGWSGGEICLACHTPHNADVSVALSPLWNHEVTTATYTTYTSSTLDATVGQPDGISKLCLSCHDGTVALNSYGGSSGSNYISAPRNVGTDISDDHPISLTYDAALAIADGSLADPSDPSGIVTTIDADMLFSGKLECASCHDVHNGSGVTNLLLKSNAGSALCLTCHTK